jgi:hypothetical protein
LDGVGTLSLIADGARITWASNPLVARLLTLIFYYGPGVAATVAAVVSNATDGLSASIPTTRRANAAIVALCNAAPASFNGVNRSIGYACNNLGVIQQRARGCFSAEVNPTAITGYSSSNRVGVRLASGSLATAIEVTAWNDTSVVLTTRGSGGLCIGIGAFLHTRGQVWVGNDAIDATSTGSKVVSGVGFLPNHVEIIGDGMTGSLDSIDTGASAGLFSVGHAQVPEQSSSTWRSRQNRAVSDTGSSTNTSSFIDVITGVGGTDWRAAFTAFAKGQFTMNVDDDTSGTRNVLAMAFAARANPWIPLAARSARSSFNRSLIRR